MNYIKNNPVSFSTNFSLKKKKNERQLRKFSWNSKTIKPWFDVLFFLKRFVVNNTSLNVLAKKTYLLQEREGELLVINATAFDFSFSVRP